MAKMRAYKLAEELGIDRAEFVEKAGSVGVELKSAMAALEDEQVETLREKLGSGTKRASMVEKRVERKGGRAVIRRRKRAPAPEPEPSPEVVDASGEAAAAEAGSEPAAASPPDAGAEPIVASESEVASETEAAEAEPAAEAPAPASEPAVDDAPGGAPQPVAASTPDPPTTPKSDAGAADRKGQKRKRVREVVNLREQEQFARQITGRGQPARRSAPGAAPRPVQSPRRRRRDAPAAKAPPPRPAEDQSRSVRVSGPISVGELAKLLGAKAAQVQGKLMALGTMVSVNQTIDVETARSVAEGMGFELQDVGFKEEAVLEEAAAATSSGEGITRPPIITVMGHVDHGKTSLLDAIRKTRVTEGEAGGITQHIGAYQVKSGDSTLTFIDTPGHAAFTAMRARGAGVTDIVVLVVAADDGVMPQTIEAINHARAANCPIVVAVNKIDLPNANPENVRQRLMEQNLISEEFGGDTICVNVSAAKGEGLDQLLEMLALQSEVLELKADPARRATGVVLEARLDKGRGVVATMLVQDGTLSRGDVIVVGKEWGRVRLMESDTGDRIKEAGPSVPVTLIGLSGVPEAGGAFNTVESDRQAKQVVAHRLDQERAQPIATKPRLSLDEIFAQREGEGPKELSVVLKADVHGTCEAVVDALGKLSTDKVKLDVLSSGVGGITENDVMLARASDAIVVGFGVRPDPAARRAAEGQGVEIRNYQVIMHLLDDVRDAMAGLLPPTLKENMLGRAEVKQPFTIPRIGTIAGSQVSEGKLRRGANARLIRDGVQVYEGRIGSLRRFKDDVREVTNGLECGIGIEGYNDIKPGDVIEAFEVEEQPATLD